MLDLIVGGSYADTPTRKYAQTQSRPYANMLPDSLRDALEDRLDVTIDSAATVGGGCIANACRLETDAAPFFLKYGDAEVARTFPGEAAVERLQRAVPGTAPPVPLPGHRHLRCQPLLAEERRPLVGPLVVLGQSADEVVLIEPVRVGRAPVQGREPFAEPLPEATTLAPGVDPL